MDDLSEKQKESLYRAGFRRGKHICKGLEPEHMSLESIDLILPSVSEMLESEPISVDAVCHLSGFVGAMVLEIVRLHQVNFELKGGGSDDRTTH